MPKITIKRNNSGTSQTLYPTTTVDQLLTDDGLENVFDGSNKIKVAYLPTSVFGGLQFEGALTSSNSDTDAELASLLDGVFQSQESLANMAGSFWIVNGTNFSINASLQGEQASGTSRWWATTTSYGTEEGEADGADTLSVETGDWVVIVQVTGLGTQASPYTAELAVVNNTYANASTTAKGVVELATNEQAGGSSSSLAVTPAGLSSVLSGYSTTNTTYTTSAVDSGANAIIRLTGSDSSTEDITLVAGDNIAITPSGDNITIDSSHPSISAASSVNNSGRTYIQDITLDSNGHITGITSATETVTNTDTNDYLDGISKSGNTLTFSVGSQSDVTYAFGSNAFTSTTIPSVTLNGSASTSPNFYAPTASGSAGSSSATRQALFSNGNGSAPTFVEAPKIFYDTTTGWLHGDIVFDVDA